MNSDFAESKECLELIKDQQPLSLKTLSFVETSIVMGTDSKRSNNVDNSGLPKSIQEDLLFKGQGPRLCVTQWHELMLDRDQSVTECACDSCVGTRGIRFL